VKMASQLWNRKMHQLLAWCRSSCKKGEGKINVSTGCDAGGIRVCVEGCGSGIAQDRQDI
jgi:hypothetical protein